MTASASDRFVGVLLSCLLPGDGAWPAAAQTQLPAWFGERLKESPPLATAVDWMRATVPPDTDERDADWLAAHLKACEAADPARFALIVAEAFNGYYTDPTVLGVIERRTGFPARPPQPEGHRLEPFDRSMLRRLQERGVPET